MTASSITTWQGILASQQTQLTRNAKSPSVKAALDYFNKTAPKITSVDQLLKDRKLLSTVLTTYGLDSEISNVGKLRQLLTQDPKDPKSLVNRLVDPRFTKFVVDLSFANGPPAGLKDPAYTTKFAQTYTLNSYEIGLGNQDPALREAAYFMRNIGNVQNVFQILSDKVLTDVVTKALQLPSGFSGLDIDQQAAILTKRLDLKALQNAIGANAAKFADASADQVKITDATNLSQAASGVVKSVSDELAEIEKSYQALVARQDPSGVNTAKIADQTTYVSDLARVRGLLDAATARTADIPSSIDRLQQIIQLAPTADLNTLNALKTEFASTVARLNNNLDNAGYKPPAGGPVESLIKTPPAVSISITVPGGTFVFNGTDLSSVKASLTSANAAFSVLAVGAPASASAAADLTNARADTVAGQAFLVQQGATYAQALSKVDNSVSAFQQSLVFRADSSAKDALSRITQISSKLINLQAALENAVGTGANRTAIDASVQSLKADIKNLIKTSGGGTDNLLTTVGGYGSEQGISLTIRSADLLTQLSNKLDNVNALSATNAQAGADLISGTLRPLLTAKKAILQTDANYVQAAAASSVFVITPDTAQLRLGSQSAADALSRATTIGTLLGQLRDLATTAGKAGNGSTEIDAFGVKASDLIQKINTAITTPGAGLDNLLVGGGDQAYNFVGASQLHINKGDLSTTISGLLATIDLTTPGSTAATQDAIDKITNTLLPTLQDTRLGLTTGQKSIDTARTTFDPRAALDDRFAAAVSNIAPQVATATIGKNNLLTSVADQLLFLKSSPGTYNVSGHGEFDQRVTKDLKTAVSSLLTNSTSPTTAIHQALLALNSIYVDLTGDISIVKFHAKPVNDLLDQKSKIETQQLVNPYQGTSKAKLITNQFLAFSDGPTTGTAQSLAQVLLGTSNTTSILNLLI